jgi:hypothetical protein
MWERIVTGLNWPHVLLATWARCLAIRSVLESGLPRGYSCCRKPRYLSVASELIPVPGILNRQFPCLLRHKFLTRDFLGVRQIRSELLRPQLYTNDLSWHTISWYYPFKYPDCRLLSGVTFMFKKKKALSAVTFLRRIWTGLTTYFKKRNSFEGHPVDSWRSFFSLSWKALHWNWQLSHS